MPTDPAGADGTTQTVRIDLHCHSRFSAMTDAWMAELLGIQDCYTDPEVLYANAKARGMTHVTLTDRDTIAGGLRLLDYRDFILGEEVTAFFHSESLHVDVLVWGLDADQHDEIQRRRYDVVKLVEYLREQKLAYGLAHPASFGIGGLRQEHYELLLLLFPLWELRDGHSHPVANELSRRLIHDGCYDLPELAQRHGLPEPPAPRGFAGSDDRSSLDVGTTYTELAVPGAAIAQVGAEDLAAALRTSPLTCHGEEGSTEKTAHTGISLFAGTAASGSRIASWMVRRSQRSPAVWSFITSRTGRRVAGRALSLYTMTSRFGRAETWQSSAASELGAAIARGEVKGKERHARMAGAAEKAWTRALTQNLARIQERSEQGSLPDEEIKQIVTAQALLAPYFAAAAYRSRQRRHAERVERILVQAGLLPEPVTPPAPRIALFTDTYREVNGVTTILQRFHEHALGRGWPLTIIDSGPEEERSPGRYSFKAVESLAWSVYRDYPMNILPPLELMRWCETQDVDLIHAATPGPVGIAAVLAAKALDLPLIGTYHTDLPHLGYFLTRDHTAEELLWSYVRWFYGQCQIVLCPSQLVIQDLTEHGVHSHLVPFDQAIDGDQFSPARRDEALHAELGDGRKIVLWVGRVSPEKGLPILASAYRRLLERRDDVRLVLVGDGPYRATLEGQLPQATFLGYRSGEELSRIYASADIFAFPGISETFGQVVLEAAASGLPSVISAGVAVDEIIERGQSGLTVAPGDAEGFAEAIETLLDDDDLRRRMGEEARRRALARDWASTFDSIWVRYVRAAR
jgi:glycosyltransferase involved in cell wall biosynthesis